MIEEYKFGSVTIDGKTYNHDVEVRWTGEVLDWWRKESHIIDVDDVKRALEQNPKTIIIGTGESGMAKVSDRLKQEVKSKGIESIIDQTEQATKTFNIIVKEHSFVEPEARREKKLVSSTFFTLRFARVNDESAGEEGEQRKVIGLFHLTC